MHFDEIMDTDDENDEEFWFIIMLCLIQEFWFSDFQTFRILISESTFYFKPLSNKNKNKSKQNKIKQIANHNFQQN